MNENTTNLPSYDGLFTAIVPCKNEEAMITIFYDEFVKVMSLFSNPKFEIIFVDDGSTDFTLEKIKELAQNDDRVRYISFSRNFGKESAMYAGFQSAKGDYIAVMDADLQDPPALLPEMFSKIKNCDCVATRRITRTEEPPIRTFFAKVFYKVLNTISSLNFKEGARDFRLIRRNVLNEILRLGEYNRFVKGMYEWVGFRTEWIEFENCPRVAGETKWSLWGLLLYSIEAFTSFSTIPLAIVSIVGLSFCLFSIFAILFVAIRQMLFHNSAFGWTSLVCILFFLSGLQLFCLGVLGQYISKIYLESKRRPIYVVKEKSR